MLGFAALSPTYPSMQSTGGGPCRFSSSMTARTRRMTVSGSTPAAEARGTSGTFPVEGDALTVSGTSALPALQTGGAPAIMDIVHKIGTRNRRIEFIAHPCYLTGPTTCLFPRAGSSLSACPGCVDDPHDHGDTNRHQHQGDDAF